MAAHRSAEEAILFETIGTWHDPAVRRAALRTLAALAAVFLLMMLLFIAIAG